MGATWPGSTMNVSGFAGRNASAISAAANRRHFHVSAGGELRLADVTLTGGASSVDTCASLSACGAGSVLVSGSLSHLFAIGVSFIGNSAYHGGAVAVDQEGAQATFENSRFNGNTGQAGTAVYVANGASVFFNGGDNDVQNNVAINGEVPSLSVYMHVGSVSFDE